MAATYNLGSAVATIVVTSDTKGVSDASNAVEDFGRKGERTSKILDIALGNIIAQAAMKAFDAITNLAGSIWDLGMDRAVAIENAEAKLRGLGNSAEDVEGIMKNALDAVKGTQFGLGEAATIAATAVAAGIKPGQDLERQLKLVANAAAASGGSMSDMGGILRKVWTDGKVDMEIINQLGDRGIPIFDKLAEAYGVSGAELREMVSNGQIDMETFTSSLESSVGSVAAEMGGTFEGMSANAQAALGRLGEKAAGALLPYLSEALQLVIELADGFGQKFGPIIEQVATQIGSNLVDAIKTGIDMMTNLGHFISDNSTWLGPLAVAIGAVAAAMIVWETAIKAWTIAQTAAKLIQDAFNASMLANPIGAVIAAIVALVAGLVWFFTQTELGREVWANFTRFVALRTFGGGHGVSPPAARSMRSR
ncbi:tape measure protein [Microbacterium lacticum]